MLEEGRRSVKKNVRIHIISVWLPAPVSSNSHDQVQVVPLSSNNTRKLVSLSTLLQVSLLIGRH
jgi:hypothetical protein